MLLGIFGVPSRSTALGAEIVRALLASFYGACEVVSPDSIQDVRGLCAQDRKAFICYSELPEGSLAQFLLDERVPMIVFLNGLAATSRALVVERGMPALEAIRAASLSIAALNDTVSAENIFTVSSYNNINNVYSLLRQITQFIGVQVSSDAIAKTMQSLQLRKDVDGGIYLERQTANAAAVPDAAIIAQVDTLSCSLQDYDQLIERGFIDSITWPGAIFHLLDKSSAPAIESVDLLGPARYLVSGPFMGLPRGTWLASIAFSVADNISGNKIMFDVAAAFGTEMLTKVECNLPKEGTFLAEFGFEHSKPHLPLELRSFLMQGAIEGKFNFKNVILKQQGQAAIRG